MGRRGQMPTPTRVLELRGSPLAKKRKAGGEPQPDGEAAGCPTRPRWVTERPEARRCWDYHVHKLRDSGLLTRLDINVFASYCDVWSMYRAASDAVHKGGTMRDSYDDEGNAIGPEERPEFAQVLRIRATLDKLERKLGLSPADRAGFVALDKPQRDSAEQSLERRLFGGPA